MSKKVFIILFTAVVMVSFVFAGHPVFAAPSSEPGATSAPAMVQPQGAAPGDPHMEPAYGVTGYSMFFLPAASFSPRNSTTTFAYSGLGYIYRTGGDDMFWAPLVLPPGALLHGIRIFYYDNSASNITVWVTKYIGDTAPITTDITSWSTSGTPGYASDYIYVGETIRYEDPANGYQEQGYVVNVALPDASANMMFKGVRVLYYLQMSPAPATATFSDVPPSSPYFQFVEALYAAGIVSGCWTTPLSYCPDTPVTKGQMAAFFARALGLYWQY